MANVSHELRTPITSIKGFVETLLDGAWRTRTTPIRFLQIMLRQVNRLDAIIGDLLVLSRIEQGSEEQTIELAANPIRERAAGGRRNVREEGGRQGRSGSNCVCPDDWSAQINAPLLEQAVINLMDNAIKYSEPGSAVEIERRPRRRASW